MRLRVLGGCGAWPAAGQACSGYLVDHDGFRLLIDPGYAILPKLLEVIGADLIDAVLISHGHADHCADLNPLLRARVLHDDPAPPVAVYTLPSAIDRVLALDRPGMLDDAYTLHEFAAGEQLEIGPFRIETWPLPHSVPNAGTRVVVDGLTLAYTGDSGPSRDLRELAHGADLLLAEATFADHVPANSAAFLSSARQAGQLAAHASVKHLMLTHLMPDSDPAVAEQAARDGYVGPITVARPGTVFDLGDAAILTAP
jgi:ribonuclease BN (tRNA processing enzyme)